MACKQRPCSFLVLLVILPYRHALSRFSSQTRQTIRPACVTYRPNVPKSILINNGDCKQEVGKVTGLPITNSPTTLKEIRMRGYYVTSYNILSKDGYYSAIYRISGGPKSPPINGNQSILLFHGGGGGSASWIIQPGSRNLAFLLVDNGYEVWLANARGTIPSMNHTNLNAETDLEYWDFTNEDVGTKDLPLFVDRIRWVTGNKQVYYVCHSMGCAIFLAGLAQLPEMSSNFKAGFLLGPAVFIGSGENPFIQVQSALFSSDTVKTVVFKLLGGRINGEPTSLMRALGLTIENVCTWSAIRCGVCDNALFAFYGQDAPQLNYTEFPNILRKLMDSYGLKMFFHGIQDHDSCQFRRFNYGEKKNRSVYGSSEPPSYNMDNVRVPLYIWAGESDNLVSPLDTERLWSNIQPKYRGGLYKVNWPLFHHIDFLMAKDADILVYNDILDHIRRIEEDIYHDQSYYYKWTR